MAVSDDGVCLYHRMLEEARGVFALVQRLRSAARCYSGPLFVSAGGQRNMLNANSRLVTKVAVGFFFMVLTYDGWCVI